MVVPAQWRNIYSVDNGTTWQYQSLVEDQNVTGESTIMELGTGELYRNDRASGDYYTSAKRRWVSTGTLADGFADFAPDCNLLDDQCEASILCYTPSPNRIVFLNSSSTTSWTKMEVRVSYDDCVSWPITRFLSDDPFTTADSGFISGAKEGGYSSMAKTWDDYVGALVEVDLNTSDSFTDTNLSIAFRKFNRPWFLNGAPEPTS